MSRGELRWHLRASVVQPGAPQAEAAPAPTLTRVVVHHKRVLLAARRPEARLPRQPAAQCVSQVLVRGPRQAARLVNEREDAQRATAALEAAWG